MKKYVKPELFFEKYELSQHIADCAWEMQYANKDTCNATGDEKFGMNGLGTLFTTTPTCDNTAHEVYCYTNGAEGVNVFIS